MSCELYLRQRNQIHVQIHVLKKGRKKTPDESGVFKQLAERAGLEPAAFRVTGGRYNQLN